MGVVGAGLLAGTAMSLIADETMTPLAGFRRTGGRRPKLALAQAQHAQQLYDAGEHTVQQIADLLGVKRTTVYGHLNKPSRRPAT